MFYLNRQVHDPQKNKFVGVHLKVYDEGFTIPIYSAILDSYLLINVYSYEIVEKQYKSVEPFIGFYDNKMILFCNDIDSLDLEKISYDVEMYDKAGLFNKFDYRDNFDQYKICNKTYKIFWNLSKNMSYKFLENKNAFVIEYDGTISRYEAMTNILKDLYCDDLVQFTKKQIGILGLQDKIMTIDFDDIQCDYEKLPDGKYVTVKSSSIMGVCEQQHCRSDKKIFKYDSPYKSKITYNPHIVYQSPQTQKFLIIHELCHAKIGCSHAHDKLFWYMFEYYNKMDRHIDWAYNEDQEDDDNIKFKRKTGLDIDPLTKIYMRQYPLNEKIQTIQNYDWIGSYSGLGDSERQFDTKKYKRTINDFVKTSLDLVKNKKYPEVQDIARRFFQWNSMASKFIQSFEKEDQIIIEDISNCFCKIFFAIEDKWSNKDELCKIQLGKIKQLIDILGDPIEVENPENILNEAKLRRDLFYQKFVKKASDTDINSKKGDKDKPSYKKGDNNEPTKHSRVFKRKN